MDKWQTKSLPFNEPYCKSTVMHIVNIAYPDYSVVCVCMYVCMYVSAMQSAWMNHYCTFHGDSVYSMWHSYLQFFHRHATWLSVGSHMLLFRLSKYVRRWHTHVHYLPNVTIKSWFVCWSSFLAFTVRSTVTFTPALPISMPLRPATTVVSCTRPPLWGLLHKAPQLVTVTVFCHFLYTSLWNCCSHKCSCRVFSCLWWIITEFYRSK